LGHSDLALSYFNPASFFSRSALRVRTAKTKCLAKDSECSLIIGLSFTSTRVTYSYLVYEFTIMIEDRLFIRAILIDSFVYFKIDLIGRDTKVHG